MVPKGYKPMATAGRVRSIGVVFLSDSGHPLDREWKACSSKEIIAKQGWLLHYSNESLCDTATSSSIQSFSST